MITANELRVGNRLLKGNKEIIVSPREIDWCGKSFHTNKSFNDFHQPIHFTKEVAERCEQFVLIKSEDQYNIYSAFDFEITVSDFGATIVAEGHLKDFNYLHELQNIIYYWTNGQELKIREV